MKDGFINGEQFGINRPTFKPKPDCTKCKGKGWYWEKPVEGYIGPYIPVKKTCPCVGGGLFNPIWFTTERM